MEITAAYLRERLDYDRDTGIFRWKPIVGPREKYWNAHRAGTVAGSRNGKGYLCIVMHRKSYRLHRLAWLYVYGRFPQFEIDHIDRCRTNNRISNLRDVPSQVNVMNREVAPGKSGIDGVRLNDRMTKATWSAKFGNKHLGTFSTVDEAVAARSSAVEEYFVSHGVEL